MTLEEQEAMRDLLREWLKFSEDVSASDAAGQDWLEMLRAKTRASVT